MPTPTLSDAAKADFREIILRSYEHFGDLAAERYQKLMQTAVLHVGENPHSILSKPYGKSRKAVRFYHLRHSREEAAIDGLVVQTPRHFIVYNVQDNGEIEIVRFLHDSMDFSRHL